MKRKIKRTEITIETVEITTIRRARSDDDRGDAIRSETIVMHLSPGSSADPIEIAAGADPSRSSDGAVE